MISVLRWRDAGHLSTELGLLAPGQFGLDLRNASLQILTVPQRRRPGPWREMDPLGGVPVRISIEILTEPGLELAQFFVKLAPRELNEIC